MAHHTSHMWQHLQASESVSFVNYSNEIMNNTTTNVLTGLGSGSPNPLLYSLFLKF